MRARPYLEVSSEIQSRYRELTETFRVRSDGTPDLEYQEFDFVLGIDEESQEVQPLGYKNRQSEEIMQGGEEGNYFLSPIKNDSEGDGNQESDREKIEISRFNRGFLRSLEPLLFYYNHFGDGEDREEVYLKKTVPTWMVVLEVKEGGLNYSIFSTKRNQRRENSECYGLGSPIGISKAHDVYDNVKEESDIIDLSHLYTLGEEITEEIKPSYLTAAITVVDGENDQNYESWRNKCESEGVNLNAVKIYNEIVNKIDNRLKKKELEPEISRSTMRSKIKEVKSYCIENNEIDIEGKVNFDEDAQDGWIEQFWEKEDYKEGILLYFIWLRSMTITADGDVNFKVYLYFPNPDLSGEYVHTVTAAFADWPVPEWVLLAERSAPKLFQRSALLLSRDTAEKTTEQNASLFGHEVKQIAQAITDKWLVKPESDVQEHLLNMESPPEWTESPWRVYPFPQLLESAGRVIKLWCQLDRPSEVLGESRPSTLQALATECWLISKSAIKVHSLRGRNLGKKGRVLDVKEDINEIDELWSLDKGFQISGDMDAEIVWGDNKTELMDLIRLLLACFFDCVRHADSKKPVSVSIRENRKEVVIEITNYYFSKEHDSLSTIRGAMEQLRVVPLKRDESKRFHGNEVIQILADRLSARVDPLEEQGDLRTRRIIIPTKILRGEPND